MLSSRKNCTYVICAILSFLVLFGIYLMSKVEKAPLGNALSATALGLGIILTLVHKEILTVWVLYPALALGACIGLILALRVRMIEIPQLVGLLNGVGGGASALVGLFAYLEAGDYFSKATALLAVAVGMVTLLGSLVAAGKLHKLLPQKPLVLPMHTLLTGFFLILTLLAIILGTVNPWNLGHVFWLLLLSLLPFSEPSSRPRGRCRHADHDFASEQSQRRRCGNQRPAVADVLFVSVGAIVGASGLAHANHVQGNEQEASGHTLGEDDRFPNRRKGN